MYRIEIFDMYTRQFKDAFVVGDEFVIKEDYLSPVIFDINAPAGLNAEIRNTVQIKEGNSRYFSGYISNIERTETKTVLTVSPLLLLLNEKSVQNPDTTDFRRQIDKQIGYDFRNPSPSLFPLPFYRYSDTSFDNWDGVTIPYAGGDLLNDFECIMMAAKTYGKFMSSGIGVSTRWLGVPHYGFKKFTTTRTIERDLENIVEKEITETSRNGYNILIVWVQSPDYADRYLHYTVIYKNGEIIPYRTVAQKREIEDPRLATKVYNEAKTLSYDELYKLGLQYLKPQTDSYDIYLTVRRDDKIINPLPLSYGQPVNIISGGKTYSTYYTGREISRDTVKLHFGMTRQTLTSILNNERENET